MQLQTQSWTCSGRLLFAHSAGALRVTHCLGVGQPVPRAVLVSTVIPSKLYQAATQTELTHLHLKLDSELAARLTTGAMHWPLSVLFAIYRNSSRLSSLTHTILNIFYLVTGRSQDEDTSIVKIVDNTLVICLIIDDDETNCRNQVGSLVN